ncbi:MAG: mandelate racemase/muconate lactonizing enzyme family protein [Christensenellales bacterium]
MIPLLFITTYQISDKLKRLYIYRVGRNVHEDSERHCSCHPGAAWRRKRSILFFSGLGDLPRSSVIVEVITQDGESGFGECMCHGQQPPQIAAAFIENCYKPILLGRDIYDVEVLWEECYNRSRPFGQQGAAINALSGVDIAIWDSIGRHLGKPVSKIIGGNFRNRVRAYATGFYRRKNGVYPEDAIREAEGYIAKGFTGMKLKTGFGPETDIAYIRALRKAVGPNIRLMADFNCAYNQAVARRIILELEEEKLEFFEELLAPEDINGYAAIRNLTGSYIAAGENLFGKATYKLWLEKGALDIYQPDLCSSGGFTELKKIAAIAQAYNTMVIPHVWGSGVGPCRVSAIYRKPADCTALAYTGRADAGVRPV